ncbi:MAG: hypothetical protein AAGA46_14115 [Cyanobacteria bacterium P01_F01_bin.13]
MIVGAHRQLRSPLAGLAWVLSVLIMVVPRLLLPLQANPVQLMVAELGLTALRLSVVYHSLSQRYRVITLEQYGRLTRDMHLLMVERLIGPGQQIDVNHLQDDAVAITYEWQNPDGSRLIATFQDMKLTSKAQTGLKPL